MFALKGKKAPFASEKCNVEVIFFQRLHGGDKQAWNKYLFEFELMRLRILKNGIQADAGSILSAPPQDNEGLEDLPSHSFFVENRVDKPSFRGR